MATAQIDTVLQQVQRSVLLQEARGRTDGQLLEAFIACREEAAFAALRRGRSWPSGWRGAALALRPAVPG